MSGTCDVSQLLCGGRVWEKASRRHTRPEVLKKLALTDVTDGKRVRETSRAAAVGVACETAETGAKTQTAPTAAPDGDSESNARDTRHTPDTAARGSAVASRHAQQLTHRYTRHSAYATHDTMHRTPSCPHGAHAATQSAVDQ